ncbi:MAG TPA: hypothetical protein DCX14_02130 [Flavobacteriales bacterium]|nr:hypothetical protein [Flavobacteriales bacterium]
MSNAWMRLLFAVFVVLFFIGCDQCARVKCLNGGTCYNGVCVCEDGYARPSCLKDTCFQVNPCKHGNCEYGYCICDENWIGEKCDSLDYVDHSGDYFGGFICDGYQTLSFVGVDKTSDRRRFQIRENEFNIVYNAIFQGPHNFTVDSQLARDYNGIKTYVHGSGSIKDKELEMEIYYTTDGDSDVCMFDGKRNDL